ncbi:DUF551 domain-containing protein [Cronobacter sakazakii]|uniref:DUF551 domain-containing protein n=1 Tax=Cronobacter sakazakii TaxID=28141 RepID=UPI00039E697C|nr:DUF551 domain-containing protein [Cronobacter sakazakii]
MSTISNERLEELANGDMEVWNSESQSMARELLALRKEREKAEPVVCQKCGNTGLADSGGVQPWGEPILIECDCTAPPAPSADDSLPYDPQIAEYEQMMEAEQAQAGTTAQQFESLAGKAVVPEGWKLVPIELTKEMRGKIHPFAEALCHGCGREVVADCEDNVTASWNDMLAVAPTPVGKQSSTAEGNNDGFECTPVADLYELLTKCGECYDYTTSAKVAADWIKEGYSAREYVKLDRLQEAMTLGSSGEADGWIPCSERLPVEKDIVLVVDDGYFVCEAQYRGGDFFSAVRGNNEFFETTCRDVEFWQPLPEPPCK